ncbi:molybdate transport system regulatory protein [Plasticicumulans lactativorans]|uniref:Molybdate transport system regulatory protein n=1 Tax=Plasticicumulans lactativorans TaxID=1133106 RepID=A0A4R2KZC0_9GAMM|nr:TOBE domain-containing protein [Plasticicumulans lactativorans]TCO79273.1 molybdate transport system regulatory protein [Plasticicumulans lactativorans]
MQISARNQFAGTVSAVHRGAVNAEVTIAVNAADTVVATITNGAVDALGLAVGHAAVAVFKASSVLLGTGAPARLSARNVFAGRVVSVVEGPVSAEVTLATPAGLQVTATVTEVSARTLGLVPGAEAYALVKASSVLVGID